MSDRHKFKAWCKKCKRFVNPVNFYVVGSGELVCRCEAHDEVNQCELIQCTGLKDKNGVLIWEGDVVRGADNCEHQGQSEVFYGYGQWQPFSYLGTYNGNDFEIIGNKFENPELL